jgi:hypothetical protein
MIISLFMNAAPWRDGSDGFHVVAERRPAGQEAGELPRRERKKQKFNHRCRTAV